MHPEARAIDRRADAGEARQKQQRDRADPEEILVLLEDAVVAAQSPERERKEADTDHDPQPLPERVRVAEPVNLGHADGCQQSCHRQEVRVGVRHRPPRDEVRDEVEGEEEQRVGERPPADLRLARDVHGREAEAGENAHDGQVEELSVAVAQIQRASPHQTRTTMTAIRARMISKASMCLPMPACGASCSCAAIAA